MGKTGEEGGQKVSERGMNIKPEWVHSLIYFPGGGGKFLKGHVLCAQGEWTPGTGAPVSVEYFTQTCPVWSSKVFDFDFFFLLCTFKITIEQN